VELAIPKRHPQGPRRPSKGKTTTNSAGTPDSTEAEELTPIKFLHKPKKKGRAATLIQVLQQG
jgi:hypothetical protein